MTLLIRKYISLSRSVCETRVRGWLLLDRSSQGIGKGQETSSGPGVAKPNLREADGHVLSIPSARSCDCPRRARLFISACGEVCGLRKDE